MASKAPRAARTKAPAKTVSAADAAAPATWPMEPPALSAEEAPAIAPPEPVSALPEPAESAPAATGPIHAGIEKLAEAEAEIEHQLETVVEPAVASAPATVKETIVDTMNTVADKAQTYFASAQDKAKAAWDKSQTAVADMTDFSKGNLEAMVESGKIAATGLQSLGQEAVDYSKKSFESTVAAMKEMAAVKSPTDFFKLQGDFVRSSFDSLVAETSKNTETMLKLAGEIAQPISNRVAVAAEKVKVAA